MNGEVVYIDITVNDAVGIIYMINPVMARSALAGTSRIIVRDVAAGIINPLHIGGTPM